MWRNGLPGGNGFSWQRFTLVWAVFVFVFFSASGSKLPSYILPMFPALCLLCGWLLHDMDPRTLARLTRPTAITAAVFFALVWIGFEPVARRFIADEVSLAPALRFAPWVTAAVGVVALGSAAAVFALRGGRPRGRTAAVIAVSLSMLVAVQLGIVGYDNFRTTRSSRDILRAAEAVNGPFAADAPFYHVHMHDQTVPFYLGRPTIFVSYRDEFALGLDAEPQRGYRHRRRLAPGLGRPGAGLRDDAGPRLRALRSAGRADARARPRPAPRAGEPPMTSAAFLLLMTGVLLNAGAQLLLKAGTNVLGVITLTRENWFDTFARMATQGYFVLGAACYGISLVVWILGLSRVPVSVAYPLLSVGYIINAIAAHYLFGESVTLARWLGIGFIVVGVWLVARS